MHSLGNYSFAMGLFALGLGTWQILLALGVGSAFLFVLPACQGSWATRQVSPSR